jgi:hypothetical protein
MIDPIGLHHVEISNSKVRYKIAHNSLSLWNLEVSHSLKEETWQQASIYNSLVWFEQNMSKIR